MATTRHSLFAALFLAVATTTVSFAQTAPSVVPVPFTVVAAGEGSAATTTCAASLAATDGSQNGDGCPAVQAKLGNPQGAAVDKYGNIYIADYKNLQVRVVYNGGTQLAAAITAANSGFIPSAANHTAPAPAPVVGDIYTLAGLGAAGATTFGTGFPCANYSTSGQPAGIDNLGDGCPGAAAAVGPRDVKVDADGNLFIADFSNGRVRVLCVNCATTTLAAKLITLENPTVTAPVNGAIYTVAGVTSGYRDAAPGFGTGAVNTGDFALLRASTGVAISPSDDIYIADNTNNAVRVLYNGGAVAQSILKAEGITPTQGYVYTVAGAGCVSAATGKTGSVSTANACLTTTDSDVAGLANANGAKVVWSVYLDPNQNVFFTDETNARVKMIYGGLAAPVTLPNSIYTTLTTGYSYTFAGQGTGAPNTQNGVPPSSLVFTDVQGVGGDAFGNVFIVDYTANLFYQVYVANGIAAVIAGGGTVSTTTAAAGVYCNGGVSGPQMTDAYYDGCPATQAKITTPRGPVVADSLGNLYFGDAIAYVLRKFTYNPTFPSTAVGSTAAAQAYAFEFLTSSALSSAAINAGLSTSADYADAGGDTCNAALAISLGAPGTTCVVNVSFTPKSVGKRPASVVLSGASGILGQDYFSGIGTGAALALDPATFTTTGTGLTPAGIAVDAAAANVYVTDTTGKKAVRFTGGTATTIATGFTAPSGIAVDNAGNAYIADSTANTLTVAPNTGAAQYSFTPGLSAPHQVTTDSLGRIYVADTSNNRVVVFGAGGGKVYSVLPFTGLTAPTGVAVDSAFNVYASDSSHVVKLTPLGVQTTVATTVAPSLAVDAAGNLYSASGTTLSLITAAGAKVSLYTGLGNAAGVAVDATGNLYVGDTGNGGYDLLARTAGYYKFTGTSGTAQIQLTSIGTSAVSATAYTQTDSTDYTLTPATTNGCSGALASGSYCLINAAYLPLNPGILPDTITFTAPVSNGTPTFTLVNVSLIPAITLKAASTSLTYGQTQTLTATVYGTGNYPGTVNFYNNTTTLIGSMAVNASGVAAYTYTPPVGSYSVTATYTPSGATAPTVTSTPAVLYTVSLATPTLAVAVNPASGYASTSFTLTGTVSSTSTTPSGSVTFYLGTGATPSTLGTAALSGGVATLPTSSLPVGTDCVTASYSGDQNFAAVPRTTVCTNVAVAPGFSVTAASSSLNFQAGYQEAQTTLTINTGGRSDTITFACTGLPAKTACNFSPASVTLAGGASTVPVQMLVANSSATYGSMRTVQTITWALAPFAALAIFSLRRRRRLATLFLAVFALLGVASLSGCSSQDPNTLNVPSGSYNFNVTVNSGSTTLQTLPFTLRVP